MVEADEDESFINSDLVICSYYKIAAFFPQASQFSIQESKSRLSINLVAVDQNTYIHLGNSDAIVSPGVSIFGEYQIIRRSNLRLLEQINKEIIDENDYYRLAQDKRLTCNRSTYHARVIGQGIAVVCEGTLLDNIVGERFLVVFHKSRIAMHGILRSYRCAK
ncbi:hypothetical protein K435DRAFT_806954 [Dendrothele bispora CBS 962.96]|uniref:Uncharacterized protein n=1 Tax=Dendrothele bispora (strain CBS 962.96) TaxID=1314807 RepID=A0A4S8L692_DENBC|nr:hypothetical protein K435DRAFT_806954 [Dendrothele bispora CBS 962.96]